MTRDPHCPCALCREPAPRIGREWLSLIPLAVVIALAVLG